MKFINANNSINWLIWGDNTHTPFHDDIQTIKVGQGGLFCCVITNQSSLLGLCVQDCKSLCAAVTTCGTRLTSRHTHRQHFDQLTWIAPQQLTEKVMFGCLCVCDGHDHLVTLRQYIRAGNGSMGYGSSNIWQSEIANSRPIDKDKRQTFIIIMMML